MHFKSARLIFNTKMQPNDTVDDYVAKMQQLARSIKADEKMVRFAILNGLLPHIANYVTQKQPITITELLDAARIAELTHPVAAETDTAVTAQLAGVQEQLRQLTAKWDNSVVASVNRPDELKRSWTPPREQSPRKVRFSEDQQYPYKWFDAPNRPSRGFSTRGRYSCSRRDGRDTRYSGFSGFSGLYGMQPYNPQPAYDVQPSNFYAGQSNQPPVMTQMQTQCPKCGGQRHESFNSFPAVNKNCWFCSNKGHFLRECRDAARAGMQQQ